MGTPALNRGTPALIRGTSAPSQGTPAPSQGTPAQSQGASVCVGLMVVSLCVCWTDGGLCVCVGLMEGVCWGTLVLVLGYPGSDVGQGTEGGGAAAEASGGRQRDHARARPLRGLHHHRPAGPLPKLHNPFASQALVPAL